MTAISAEPTHVASEVLARLETAWNQGDGYAFGAVYSPEASFVTIRGECLTGADAISRGHEGIFTTIYAGSSNRMALVHARELADGVILAVSENTLRCPSGPLVGVHRAVSTNVLTRNPDGNGSWRIIATQNTLEGN